MLVVFDRCVVVGSAVQVFGLEKAGRHVATRFWRRGQDGAGEERQEQASVCLVFLWFVLRVSVQ